jgi:hypothetical protein
MEGEEKAREEKEKKKREEAAAKRMIRVRMGEEWVGGRVRTRRRQKRKRSERKRGQSDKILLKSKGWQHRYFQQTLKFRGCTSPYT